MVPRWRSASATEAVASASDGIAFVVASVAAARASLPLASSSHNSVVLSTEPRFALWCGDSAWSAEDILCRGDVWGGGGALAAAGFSFFVRRPLSRLNSSALQKCSALSSAQKRDAALRKKVGRAGRRRRALLRASFSPWRGQIKSDAKRKVELASPTRVMKRGVEPR